MIIVFRVDSSNIIGSGHVQRCLNFAQLYENKNTILFITKKHLFSLSEKIKKKYTCYELELENFNKVNLDYNTWLGEEELIDAEKTISVLKKNNIDADWLIIDHYAITPTKKKNETKRRSLKIAKIASYSVYITRSFMTSFKG